MSVDCLLVTKPQTPVACAIDKPKFICESLLESLFWAPTCVPGFEHAPSGATLQKLLNRVKLHLLHRPKTTAAVASVISSGLAAYMYFLATQELSCRRAPTAKPSVQLHAELSVYPKFWGYQVFIYSGYCSCHCRLPSEESMSGIPLI